MMIEGARILVVDDHVYLAENIAEILEGEGYQTRVAISAEQALDTLDQDEIHAVITDYRLPGRNGAQLIREMRRRGRQIPAVVMSAYSDEETIAAARAAGAQEVLTKPVMIVQLLGLVAAFWS
jgi:CheY-like chemotaxis protein